MVSLTVGVEQQSATLPLTSKAGSLVLDHVGVAYEEPSGSRWQWPWTEVRLEFEPPIEAADRSGVAAMLALVGLGDGKNRRPGLRLSAEDDRIAFDLPNVEGDLLLVASRIVALFPEAAGRLSVGDRQVG